MEVVSGVSDTHSSCRKYEAASEFLDLEQLWMSDLRGYGSWCYIVYLLV